MAKTVACIVIKAANVFSWLGHMPIVNWSLSQLTDVRGIDRIVCVVEPKLLDRAKKLLSKEDIEVLPIPKDVVSAKESVLEKWLTSVDGPAAFADIVVLTKPTSPFLPAAKIEACLNNVVRGKCSTCVPARDAAIVTKTSSRKTVMKAALETVKVFKVSVPVEETTFHTVPISLMESLDIDNHDEFVMASAMVDNDKV